MKKIKISPNMRKQFIGIAKWYKNKAELHEAIIRYIQNNEVYIVGTIIERGEITIKLKDIDEKQEEEVSKETE